MFGNTEQYEYICTSYEKLSHTFSVSLSLTEKEFSEDVTTSHILLGYKPLLIGIISETTSPIYETFSSSTQITLHFSTQILPIKNIARLTLKKLTERKFTERSLFIYEGKHGQHTFLSGAHKLTNILYERFIRKGANNINLQNNLCKQVAIAYSIPRIISIITVGKNNLYNVFPTDLHGAIDSENYVSSLRPDGKACKQVEETKKIVVANVESSYCAGAYVLGKNHMRDFQEIDASTLMPDRSDLFNYPLLKETISYKEMELTGYFDAGIHRILFYKIVNEKIISKDASTLSHVHKYYVAWRTKKGLSTERFSR